ncbi:uncharacterized protein [Bos indicus]|uniref:Uncharacterized protein isoform X1 n=1 Tax=Bos indicus TaxID=9915 RepID=A0ABM4QS47_BOSIN
MAAAGAGPGPGPGAPPGLEAALQKLALRRKKVLSAEEMELFELAQAAGGAMDPDVFKILVDLLKLNVAPLAVFQMLKSMCAGQRVASDSQDPTAAPLPTPSVPETREASFLSARSRSPPARPSFSCAPQPAASPVLLHGPAAAHSPLSPGPPGSLRFSCCLFSPFAGCVYWFISGGWYCYHGNHRSLQKEQLWAAGARVGLSAPELAVWSISPWGPPCLVPEPGMWRLRPSLSAKSTAGQMRSSPAAPGLPGTSARGPLPRGVGRGLRGTCAACVVRSVAGLQHRSSPCWVRPTPPPPAGPGHQAPPACAAGGGAAVVSPPHPAACH